MRTEGTRNLVTAARAAGARHFLAAAAQATPPLILAPTGVVVLAEEA